MRALLLAATAAIALAAPALADQRFEATLAGHAILPAATFVAPPAGAPPGFAISGRFTGPGNTRNERVGSVPGDTGPTLWAADHRPVAALPGPARPRLLRHQAGR